MILCPSSQSVKVSLKRTSRQLLRNFPEFYEKWVMKLEEIFHQLLEVSRTRTEVVRTEQQLVAVVAGVTSHLKEYYTVKWASAHDEDVLVFFSPTWTSPLENAYLWITGWKPSTVFSLVETLKSSNVFVMTEDQVRRVEQLKVRIKMEEEKVEREMERQQVAMADRKIVELIKLTNKTRKNGGGSGGAGGSGSSGSGSGSGSGGGDEIDAAVDVALKEVLAGLERVMKASDCVRLKTLKGVLDVLTPFQCVDFLAANIAVQLRLRQWGKKTDMAASSPPNVS
ncbi:hypothetical protein VNO78_29122 [Psophocarpus tetragonolobus]|uniref:DOG1 domain-containing protein n=1 Tax=Psophocarpus tetragonolobus TaxID=3891 RepID=A0AAN9X077_PSOTE